MKIFLFGSNGMLGNYVKTYLKYEVVAFTRQDYDIFKLNIDSLRELLKNLNENDVVINCAGVIPQTQKTDVRLYFTVNSLFPVILSFICKEKKAKMIHITTDCVFSGEMGNYDEDSNHDETNTYGISKSLGELCDASIIRTSIIGEEVSNKRSLLEWVKSNQAKNINGFYNHYWNGVTCLQLAKIIQKILDEQIYWKGGRHIFSPYRVSKYELVSMINDIYKLNIKINKYQTEKTVDKTVTTCKKQIFEIPDIREQIQELKEFNFLGTC
jgi:dTDP-4-dehydrorhamnose reductase